MSEQKYFGEQVEIIESLGLNVLHEKLLNEIDHEERLPKLKGEYYSMELIDFLRAYDYRQMLSRVNDTMADPEELLLLDFVASVYPEHVDPEKEDYDWVHPKVMIDIFNDVMSSQHSTVDWEVEQRKNYAFRCVQELTHVPSSTSIVYIEGFPGNKLNPIDIEKYYDWSQELESWLMKLN